MPTGYNMPDGVSENDIPGWNAVGADLTMTCPNGHSWDEYVECDSDGEVESMESCEVCGEHGVGEFTYFGDQADAYADAKLDREEYWGD